MSSMIKKFSIEHTPTYASITVQIDFGFKIKHNPNFTVEGAIKEMVEFWTGYEKRLDQNDGDYTKTFLKQLCQECIVIQMSENYNLLGIIKEFNDREGWNKMDGDYGIEIVSFEPTDFSDQSDYEIEDRK